MACHLALPSFLYPFPGYSMVNLPFLYGLSFGGSFWSCRKRFVLGSFFSTFSSVSFYLPFHFLCGRYCKDTRKKPPRTPAFSTLRFTSFVSSFFHCLIFHAVFTVWLAFHGLREYFLFSFLSIKLALFEYVPPLFLCSSFLPSHFFSQMQRLGFVFSFLILVFSSSSLDSLFFFFSWDFFFFIPRLQLGGGSRQEADPFCSRWRGTPFQKFPIHKTGFRHAVNPGSLSP